MGPLAAYVMKRLDALWEGKVKAGFEMLVNMFSAGITAFVMSILGFFVLARIVNAVMEGLGNVVENLVDNNLLPADLDHHRAGEGPVPQQRHQPRRADAARPAGGGRAGQVGAVPAGGQPGSRPRAAVGVRGLRQGHCEGHRPRRRRHPVLRRHPRDLLPLRADEAEADHRHDPRRHDRVSLINVAFDVGLRGTGSAGVDLRGVRADGEGRLPRRDAGRLRRSRRHPSRSRRSCSGWRSGDDEDDLAAATADMESNKGKKSSVAAALLGRGRTTSTGDPLDRVRLRRGHGLLRHGCLGAPQEDPGRRSRRGDGRQQGDRQPDRHLRPGGHPPGPHRAGPAEDAVGDPRVGRQLHGQPEVRRDRRS